MSIHLHGSSIISSNTISKSKEKEKGFNGGLKRKRKRKRHQYVAPLHVNRMNPELLSSIRSLLLLTLCTISTIVTSITTIMDSTILHFHSFFKFTLNLIVYFMIIFNFFGVSGELYAEPRPRCEEIVVPMCRGIGYNMTSMPNQFHHEKQDEAGLEAHQFWPLVEINCSDDLRFFLCSLYTPICMEDYPDRLPACRSVCERAKAGCAAIMFQYGFPWPDSMDCNNFPPYGSSEQLCMDQKEGASNFTSSSSTTTHHKLPDSMPNKTLIHPIHPVQPVHNTPPKMIPTQSTPTVISGCQCHCRSPLVQTDSLKNIYTGNVSNCAQSCTISPYFTKNEQSTTSLMITVTACACLICSFLIVCTYFTDRSRFCYPERSIIFLSSCYMMVSAGFIFRHFLGHSSVACDGNLLRYSGQGIQPINCLVVFTMTYGFGMASYVWWVILTLAWFLSAKLKWSTEAIDGLSRYFHLLAWGIPAFQSFVAITLKAVDSEPLAGICSVGSLNRNNLLFFVIIPLCSYCIVGLLLLASGLFSLCQIQRSMAKHIRQVKDKTGLGKLMVRIIVFSLLYVGPTFVVISCYIYQYRVFNSWDTNLTCPCNNGPLDASYASIQLIKYLTTLVTGITACFWILSGKTFENWWQCVAKRFCCCCWDREPPISIDPLMGSMGSSQFIVNSQRCYNQVNQIAHSSTSVGQPHRKI